jgi:hypothetical protein
MSVSPVTSSLSPSPLPSERVPTHPVSHDSRAKPGQLARQPVRPNAATVLLWLLLAVAAVAGCTDEDSDRTGDGRPTAVFLSQSDGRAAISSPDDYVAAMSKFDRQSRTGSLAPVTVDEYLRAMPDHVLAFSAEDKQRIAAGLATVLDEMTALGLRPPAAPTEVHFIRTDGAEEGGADAYTRGDNVFLCEAYFTSDPGTQIHIIAHEMFHLWSRANPDVVRWPTHEALGFVRALSASFPASLVDLRIANPDDPLVNETIHVTIDGAPVAAFLALIAKSDYHGGGAFDYLQLQLVDVASGAVHELTSAQGLLEQIGTTTPNILSAEEISAEHFAIGVLQDMPVNDPALIQAVLKPFGP